ncbi:MAG: TldD/PmbA family protein [Candidatus Bathyarchaeota archaeon]|nr:TldD/PmbA family protein [Candidatus Bathyarchaeota archaeon]
MRNMIDKVLSKGERLGMDDIEVYCAKNLTTKIRIGSNAVTSAFTIVDEGIGVRVIKDGGLGFAAVSLTSEDELDKVLDDAVTAAKARKLGFSYEFPSLEKSTEVLGTYDSKLVSLPEEDKVGLANRMLESSIAFDPRVVDNAGDVTFIEYETVIANASGQQVSDRGTKLSAALTATAKADGVTGEDAGRRQCRSLNGFNPEAVGREAAESAVERLKARKLEAGTYDLIVDPPTVTEMFYWLLRYANPAYADTYYPTLKNKVGTKILNETVTIYDDPTYPGGYDSASIDDEGVKASRTTIFENGIFKNMIYDSVSAARKCVNGTGNALRTGLWFVINFSLFPGKNYNYEPYPEFSNMVMKLGDWSRDEIIEDTKKGVISQCFHYSRVSQHIRGDFTSILGRWKLYTVENGEVTGTTVKCRLNDNIFRMFQGVDAVGNNPLVDFGVTPTVRVKDANITAF